MIGLLATSRIVTTGTKIYSWQFPETGLSLCHSSVAYNDGLLPRLIAGAAGCRARHNGAARFPVPPQLTAQAVRNAREPGKYFDGHGLYLRVDANGSRFWVQRITIRGKRCEPGLGSPSLVTLAEARAVALENRRLARAGGDPLQARRDAAAVPTFAGAAHKVHELHKPTWTNPKHAAQFIATLETYAFPRLGKLKIPDGTTADVLAVLMPIWTVKTETARRVRQRIGTVMKWAIAQGWRQDNPAENIGQALPQITRRPVHRRALPYGDVAGCIETVRRSRL